MKVSTLIVAIFSFTLFSLSAMADTKASSPITVFIAKKIITMDSSWPDATAVAVRDGKILSVGSLEDLQPWLSKSPYTIDKTFANKVIMPGFIEPHGHPLIGGTAMTRPLLTYLPLPNPYGAAFPGVKTKAAAMDLLKQYVKQMKSPNEPLIAWGYDDEAMGGTLDAKELDTISTTQPILVWDASEHTVFTNTAALVKYHITGADAKIHGVMLDKNGNPNGQFLGTYAAAFILPRALAEVLTLDAAYKNVKFLMDLSHMNGLTTTTELAFGIINFELEHAVYNKYFNNPETPMRLMVVTDADSAKAYKGNDAIAFVKSLAGQSTDKLMFNGIKFFSDDAFLNLNMVIDNPGYIDGHHGIYITPPDQFAEKMFPWWDAGFHIHVHSNGNGGNASTIHALSQLMLRKPLFDHRFSVEHYGISTPEMAREIKVLGGVVSANPTYLYARSELNAPKMGSDRAYTAVRFKTLLDAGVPTSIHSDTPVAPPEPLKEVWMVVTRQGLSGSVHAPEERVSVDQALRMITIDAAYTIGEDHKIGSISPGKFADFTVLESDPRVVPKETIKDIVVWGTVVGGKIYPAKTFR